MRRVNLGAPANYRRRRPEIANEEMPDARGPNRNYRAGPNYGMNQLYRQLLNSPKQYKFKRTVNDPGSIVCDGINPTYGAYTPRLNELPGYTEFANVFDFYKITRITFRFWPTQTNSTSTTSINNAHNVPVFYAVDTNDATPPGSIAEICEYNDHKISRLYDGFTVSFVPKFADATSAQRSGWVATTNVGQIWYGLKYAIPPTGYGVSMNAAWTMYIECKDPK